MKKYVALLLALCMIFVLCACGAAETTAPAEESADTAAAVQTAYDGHGEQGAG